MADRILVGSLAGAFGVTGEVRVKSFCADPAAIADYLPLYTVAGQRFDQIVLTGQAKGALVARIGGITTKEEADALKGTELFADRAVMPALPDDEYYYSDLIGLTVLDTGGETLGEVLRVMDHGAGDLLEIKTPLAPDTVLVPFTQAAVPTVDLTAGRIVIDPPAGLFPDD